MKKNSIENDLKRQRPCCVDFRDVTGENLPIDQGMDFSNGSVDTRHFCAGCAIKLAISLKRLHGSPSFLLLFEGE